MNAAIVFLAGAVAASAPAQVFAPGTISSEHSDFAPAFSLSMSELMFTRGDDGASSLYVSHRDSGSWSTPVLAPFSGQWIDLESSLAPDDSYVVFASNRPAAEGGSALQAQYFGKMQSGGNLWRANRTSEGWGAPYRLSSVINLSNSVWTPTIARNDDLYFMATDAVTGRFRLHAAKQGSHPVLHDLPFSTGDANDVDPYIAPDESYMVFSSDRGAPGKDGLPGRERLYIAFHPMAADPLVCRFDVPGFEDASLTEIEARVSPDQKTLYFASRRAAHAEGQPPAGAWDNGKANIWFVPFTPALWNGSKTQSATCAAQHL